MSEQVDRDETRKDELAFLADLRRGLETGHCNSLRLSIEFFGPRLEGSADADIRAQYAEILREAEEAFRIEAIHGEGCLLQLEHPLVVDLIGGDEPRNPPIITPAEIEAARRYGSINA